MRLLRRYTSRNDEHYKVYNYHSPDRNGYPAAKIGRALERGVKVDSGK